MNTTRMLTLLLLSVCFVVLPITVEAATFTVNSTDDVADITPGDGFCATEGGVCTLRAAIQETNALAGADTIVLKTKKYYLSILGSDEDAAVTGDLDITDDLTIKGVSSAQTIINGGALDRVFHVMGPVTVKFVNLSIQNGLVQGFGGGGILNAEGAVSLVSCSVANNVAISSFAYGGGILSQGAGNRLSIKFSSIINNAVSTPDGTEGGGIAVHDGCTLNISASKIAYNSATSAFASASGGGIASSGAQGVTISNCTILANRATSLGASDAGVGGGIALRNDNTAALISGTSITMNSSYSPNSASGGGLYFNAETATISSCTVKGNTANAPVWAIGVGGGIAADSSNITVKNESTIVSNLASVNGGGIYVGSGSTIPVSPNSIVTNNMPNDQN